MTKEAVVNRNVTGEGRSRGLLGFAHAVRADRRGPNTLILSRLDAPVDIFNGNRRIRCRWRLEYRWHASEDSDLTEVRGSEFQYYLPRELPPDIRDGRKSLFEFFQLF
ncbi:MAG: hypothetical protein WC992_02340 [Acholeplasmataceae bacterium]|jgi:hypothetical protein